MGTGTGTGTEARTLAEIGGDEDDGNRNEDRTRKGGREAKKRKKPQNSCRHHVGNGGDLGRKRKKCRKESVDPVAVNPDNLESNKEAGGEHKVLGAQVRFVQVERVYPLCRV